METFKKLELEKENEELRNRLADLEEKFEYFLDFGPPRKTTAEYRIILTNNSALPVDSVTDISLVHPDIIKRNKIKINDEKIYFTTASGKLQGMGTALFDLTPRLDLDEPKYCKFYVVDFNNHEVVLGNTIIIKLK